MTAIIIAIFITAAWLDCAESDRKFAERFN